MTAPDLLACPFCGGVPSTFRQNGAVQATCDDFNCPAFDVFAPITAWNTRATPAAIREAALMTVPDEIELYYIIKASGAKKRIDVARAVSTHLEPMRRAILALITEKPHDR